MKRRLVATLLVLGTARAARADEPPAAETPPPPSEAAPPYAAQAAPAGAAPPVAPAPPVALTPAHAAPVVSLVVAPVAATPPSRGAAPLVAGGLTMFVPFVVGCALWSNSDRGDLEKAGTYVMVTGFAAAPWVSHGLQRRWKRGAAFGAVSAALSVATLVAMDEKDPFYAPYANRQRVPFGMLLTASMVSAAVGVIDSFLAAPAREAP